MSLFRTRNRLLLTKIQSAAGTEASPVPGSDAIRLTDLQYSPNFETLDLSGEVTGSLSSAAPVIGGGSVSMRGGFFLKGAGTGGNAPEWGPIMRACGFSQTLLAADVTGTATAGSATTITLAGGASAVDNFYQGMPLYITGGTGNGQFAIIASYVGSTKVATLDRTLGVALNATSVYKIPANAMYRPVSTNLEYVTMWGYDHHNDPAANSRRFRLMDGMGALQFTITPRQFARVSFTMTGKLPAAPDNVAKPAAPTYASLDPSPFLAADSVLGGSPVKFSEFSLDLGSQVNAFDDPAAAFGFDYFQITQRRPTGRIVPNMVLLSARDSFSDWINSTSRACAHTWGPTAGKRVTMFMPGLRYTGNEEQDVRGFRAEGLPFQATGLDSEVMICAH